MMWKASSVLTENMQQRSLEFIFHFIISKLLKKLTHLYMHTQQRE